MANKPITVTVPERMLEEVDRLATNWETNRSQALVRIINEWKQVNAPARPIAPTQYPKLIKLQNDDYYTFRVCALLAEGRFVTVAESVTDDEVDGVWREWLQGQRETALPAWADNKASIEDMLG